MLGTLASDDTNTGCSSTYIALRKDLSLKELEQICPEGLARDGDAMFD